MMESGTLKEYLSRIYQARYFLIHLVKWDMKYKFRRSKLGILWTILQPLLLTLIMSAVFSFVLNQEMRTYAPYILSGTLVWDVIHGSFIANSTSFVAAETYIRQYAHPMALYPLRVAMVSLCTFLIALIGLLVWGGVIYPQNLPLAVLSLPFTVLCYFLLSWSVSTISSHVYVRYRDYPYVMTLLMQFMWYLSPVFFREEMFQGDALLFRVYLLNPITQVLKLLRKPLLYGELAGPLTYLYVISMTGALLWAAWRMSKKAERAVIYYL